MPFLAVILLATLREFPEVDPPIVGQPAAFSGIVGKVRIETIVEQKEAVVEEPLTFVVRIVGEASAKHSPRRESLKIFGDDAERDFWIEPMPDRDQAKPGVWEFAYRLKAKSADVKETPTVKLVYFQPAAKRYQPTFGDRIPLTIRPRPAVVVEAKEPRVLHAPHTILELAPRPASECVWQPSTTFWLTAFLGPPLLCIAAAIALRFRNSDAQAQRRRAMHRAAQTALAKLKHVPNDDAANAVDAFAKYLATRFGWNFAELGPHEAETSLKRRGVAPDARLRCAELLAAWDRHRFSRQHANGIAWPLQATEAIRALEEDPCMARS